VSVRDEEAANHSIDSDEPAGKLSLTAAERGLSSPWRSGGRAVHPGLRRVAALAGVVVALAAPSVEAQVVPGTCSGEAPCKLTEGLPDGQFLQVRLSSDGKRAVFTYRNAGGGGDDLYSAPVDGGEAPTKLNEPDHRVGTVAISPDGTRVAYIAQIPVQGNTLFSVPIAGPSSASIRLSSDIDANTLLISPNGRLVVHESVQRDRIRAVPIEGPANGGTRLTQPFESNREIQRFAISADGKSVVYLANQDDANTLELYRVPLTLSPQPDLPTVKLNALLVAGGQVRDFFLPLGEGPAIYLADQDTLDVPELFAVRLGGEGRVKLSLPLPPNWEVGASGFDDAVPVKIFPNGSGVAYQIQEKVAEGKRPRVQLYSVPITGPGTDSVRLDDPPAALPDASSRQFDIAADGGRIVHTMASGELNAETFVLFTVPAAGPATAGTQLSTSNFADVITLSPNGARTLWNADRSLFSFQTASPGAGPAVLNGSEQPTEGFIDPTSTRVVYGELVDGVGVVALFTAAIDGSAPSRIFTSPLTGNFDDVLFTPDGGRVVYSVRDAARNEALYSSSLAPIGASASPAAKR
jgi:dipeptidyl aminopeptidase/acylaminoacyl peptidase